MNILLSKSKFLIGLQCPVWLQKSFHAKHELPPIDAQTSLFRHGPPSRRSRPLVTSERNLFIPSLFFSSSWFLILVMSLLFLSLGIMAVATSAREGIFSSVISAMTSRLPASLFVLAFLVWSPRLVWSRIFILPSLELSRVSCVLHAVKRDNDNNQQMKRFLICFHRL